VADSSWNTLYTCIVIFVFYLELCYSFTHTDSDLTSDRFALVLYNRPYMWCLIPEAWYKMAGTRTTVATDGTEPNSLRVPQTPVSEDQDTGSYLTFASLRWVQCCISLLSFFDYNWITSWHMTVSKKLTVTFLAYNFPDFPSVVPCGSGTTNFAICF